MSGQTVIDAARALITNSADWVKGCNARDSQGKMCGSLDPDAVKFDISGAIGRASANLYDTNFTNYYAALNIARSRIPGGYKSEDLDAYNDDCTHAEALAILA